MLHIRGKTQLSRRAFVGKLATGAAVAAAAGAAGLGRAEALATGGASTTPADSAPDLPPQAAQAPALAAAEARAEAGPPQAASAPPPWELLRPLAVGSVVAHGWKVAELSEVVDGSCVLTLRNQRGRAHRVHLCGNDGHPQGLVYTERFDLVVMNGGQGDLPTEEGLAQAVAEVAHVLAANESDRRQAQVVAALLPQTERAQRFAAAARLR